MDREAHQLHVCFLPYMAQGHMIPTIDMAKLFASRGSRATIITTSYFIPSLIETFEKSKAFGGAEVEVLAVKIPCLEAGLPQGTESMHMAFTPEMQLKFLNASGMLGPQLDRLLDQHRPDCLVVNVIFPWAIDVAAKFGIPCLIFHGTSYFASCAGLSVLLNEPHNKVLSDSETFIIPNLPDEIEFTRGKVPDILKREDSKLNKEMMNLEQKSYGVLMNSFYELEPVYANHYTTVFGWKTWHIGPLFLHNTKEADASVDEHECLNWLHSKKPNSVIYVSFGSVANLADDQLMEIAAGLEASGQQFIWVVKKEKKREGVRELREEWLPQGFEERMEGKGLIIRGWAPQVRILEHEAVGGFVTHCGWNSTLESICAGVPMVTWPVASEQFFNEKLVTQILRVGVEVGAKKWKRLVGDFVKREAVEKAVRKVMEGEEAEEMRSRIRGFAEMARRAVEEGGSSVSDLNALFEDLRSRRVARESS